MKNTHNIYVPDELWQQLRCFCREHYNVSCSAVICEAIKNLIEGESK